MVAGFVTQRLKLNEKPVGYRALVIQGTLEPVEMSYSENMKDVFLARGKKDIAILEQKIQEAEQAIRDKRTKIVMLDEIGGFELSSDTFMSSLLQILASGKPCVGVLKSAENLKSTLWSSGMQLEHQVQHARLAQTIQQNGELHTVTAESIQYLRSKLNHFISQAQKS
ncbi:MAG: nucleoside-triphosphatase [Coriobacteriia bacterium]|nr:nucleoside-triphosphatase [Coriobacteriia bacterium]